MGATDCHTQSVVSCIESHCGRIQSLLSLLPHGSHVDTTTPAADDVIVDRITQSLSIIVPGARDVLAEIHSDVLQPTAFEYVDASSSSDGGDVADGDFLHDLLGSRSINSWLV